MRFSLFAIVLAAVAMMQAPSAEARKFWEENDRVERATSSHKYSRSSRRSTSKSYRTSSRRGVGPRPSRWCGWWMRTQKGGGPEYNLARNWRKWGRPAGGPRVGAVVVWPHHVGMITGRAANGKWIVKSGNDSGRVRERARSVSGAVFRIG